jgi:hypothetical protein
MFGQATVGTGSYLLSGYRCKMWGGLFETGVCGMFGGGGWWQCSIGTCVSQDVNLLDICCMCVLVGYV